LSTASPSSVGFRVSFRSTHPTSYGKATIRDRRCLQGSTAAEILMLRLALFFFIVSIIAALFGFTGISAATAGIAKILFFLFIVFFLVFLIVGLMVGSALW
jgi:uncharacterized membrane protein YtjA (UPF0391 family)